MTPKEKAKDLVDKYYNFGDQEFDYSKEFALIAVDEIQEAVRYLDDDSEDYWFEVKHEIEQL
jgi:hypothetical protein